MDADVKARLLASMDLGRLVLLCGAGLSMAPPSGLPSARRVAELAFDRYRLVVDPACDPGLRSDLEALAEHFAAQGTLRTVFIGDLVPWNEFVKPSNPGHAAVADFLITRAVAAGLSTNYDELIEQTARAYGVALKRALDGDEANAHAASQAPFLKFHGCAGRDAASTIWAPSQLTDPEIAGRIQKSKTWMAANLRERDLLVIGFWSDWDYLNGVLGDALTDVNPASIVLVDPISVAELEAKAPALWAVAHRPGVTFTHVRESGAEALDELRRAFSERFLAQVFDAGRQIVEEEVGGPIDPAWAEPPNFGSEALYDWRRDAQGTPAGKPATAKHPINAGAVGAFHLLMRRAGAVLHEGGYELNGRSVRVVNGAGEVLRTMQREFAAAPSVPTTDVVVAAGATDLGVPAHIVRSGHPRSIMRPTAGGRWLDFLEGRRELDV